MKGIKLAIFRGIFLGIVFSAFINIGFGLTIKNTIDEELKPFHTKYMKMVNDNCPNNFYNNLDYQIQLKKLEDGYAGLCTRYFLTGSYKIDIDSDGWKDYNQNEKDSLVFHELSHCVLGMDHVDDKKNYMYYKMSNEDIPDLEEQVIKDIKTDCE